MRYVFLVFPIVLLLSNNIYSQGCCSGGSGSPIAGGTSQGVLNCRQLEVAGNFQRFSSNKFFTKDKNTIKLFDKLSSNYLYTRLAYGVTKDFTMSVESGYFINKTLVGLNKSDTINSSGFGDLILFPLYDLYNHKTDSVNTEITIGLGFKIPIGKHNDSTVIYIDASGNKYYTTSPPTVQPTNGSQDFIFYAFFLRGYPKKNIRLFANCLYVKKGWNSLGQKFGDYASIGLFGSTTIRKRFGVTLQVKGEWMDKMQYDKNVDMLAFYNIDVKSTGGGKVFVVPQLTYTRNNLTIYAHTEIPLYQYLNGTQIGLQYQFTAGISYSFYL
ncbi:MAG: hypothetical protein WC868_12940 [Bacteroidales bacterium]